MVDICSFCSAHAKDVKKLIINEESAICNICIGKCNEILSDLDVTDKSEMVYDSNINPVDVKKYLDQYIISQEHAKIVISVAVVNHYKRLADHKKKIITKSNIIILGPTGSGKTMLAKTVADHIHVPFTIGDATTLTEAGYVGNDVDTLLIDLLNSADGDVKLAEKGIIFLDEIDKIAKRSNDSSKLDAAGEGVQQALLKLVEGATYTITYKDTKVKFNTDNILFIASGAFAQLYKQRNKNNAKSIGFITDDTIIPDDITFNELTEFGMIPEFIGRFPIIAEVTALNEDDMLNILCSIKNNLSNQYSRLFYLSEVELSFTQDALVKISNLAIMKKTGARGLRSILEKSLLSFMFNITQYKGTKLEITSDDIQA